MTTFKQLIFKATEAVRNDGNCVDAFVQPCPECLTSKLEPKVRQMIGQELLDVCFNNHHATNADTMPVVCNDCKEMIEAIGGAL